MPVYSYSVMNKKVSATFQRLMNTVTSKLTGSEVCIDDVFSSTVIPRKIT